MNKQKLIDRIKRDKFPSPINNFQKGYNEAHEFSLSYIENLDEQQTPINEPEKPKVPQVAVEFYERYKDDNLALGEWFDDFYSTEAIEEFPRMDELTEWLYDNNDETNRQREFALATLVTLGIDAVEVEKDKLYTVEIPNPNSIGGKLVLFKQQSTGRLILDMLNPNINKPKYLHLTEPEIKQDFDWAFRWAKEV